MRTKIVSPPRVGGLHETKPIPAGCVDTMPENENRYGPLANETEDSPAAKVARLRPILADMARGVPTDLSEPCEKSVCVDREVNEVAPTEDESAPLASQMTAVPPSREAQGEPGSSGLPDGANEEGEESGGKGEDEKELPKDGDAAAAEEMDEDEEEIDLPPVEFEPEVQARLVRWSPEFPECLITLYLPMPRHMTQGAMMEAAKAALNREKQLLDMRVAAGSRVVIKVRQAELKSWLDERNWFVLENEEVKSFRGIWCLPPRADRPEKVKDSTFTVQIKGIGMNKYASDYVQQQLFSAVEDAVFTLASRAEGLFDAITMSVIGSASVGGVSLTEAFSQWSANQSASGNDRGYWKHYRRYVWVQLDGTEQRGSHNRDGRPDPSYAVVENMSLRVRVPMVMEDMVMDGLHSLIIEKLRTKWPEVECAIWPSVMESVAVEWLDSGQSEDRARNIARMGCVVRRVKLLVENVGETQYRTPVGLARLVEEGLKVQVVAVVTRTQRVEGMNHLGPLTTAQMILVCGACDSIIGSRAIPGISFSEWISGLDSLTLEPGVNLWIGEDGKPSYERTSAAPAASKDHFAEFSASLDTIIGSAHTSGLMASSSDTVEVQDMAQKAARVGAALAKAKLKQRVAVDEAQLREMGALEEEEEEDEEEEEPAAVAPTIDLVIEVQAGDESKEIVVKVKDVVAFASESRPNSGPRSQEPVTLLHAITYTLQQNDQLFLHAGFGNAAVLEKTGNDEDEVVRLIATFYKQQGEVPMKHSAVRRSSLVALMQACSIYTCRLEFAEENDPKLKYMLKQLTAEYDPADRRSPKRKERDDENGADILNASIHSLTYTNLCYRLGTDGRSSDYLNSLIRVLALGEPLFAQLGNLYEHQLRLKRTPLTRGTTIESKHLFAKTVSKGEHLFAETEIKGEHLFAETEIKGEHIFAETGTKGEHLFAETEIKGEHLFAKTEIKGEHLFAETEIKGEHLFAETEIKGEHLFAETEIKGEHLFAETGIKGEHLFAETESKGEHLLAEIKNKGEHLLAEPTNVNRKQEREPVKTKRAGW